MPRIPAYYPKQGAVVCFFLFYPDSSSPGYPVSVSFPSVNFDPWADFQSIGSGLHACNPCIGCPIVPFIYGEFAGNKNEDLVVQFETIKNLLLKKWPNSKYIGYFQAHTNTYAPVNVLKEKYETILKLDNVVGLNIATRPDSINDECLDYLEELSKKTFLTVELGLQTIHESTSKLINRCHSLDTFKEMVLKLRERNINVVVHIINGLPYETKEMMIETVKYINKLDINGVKIHMLHILKNTQLEKVVFTEILELIVKINSEKQISLLNKVSPKFLIAKVIFEKISKK